MYPKHEQQYTDSRQVELRRILLGLMMLLSILSSHQVKGGHASIGRDC